LHTPSHPGDHPNILAHGCNLTGQCLSGHLLPSRHAVPSAPMNLI
jgi:hypothetical protein